MVPVATTVPAESFISNVNSLALRERPTKAFLKSTLIGIAGTTKLLKTLSLASVASPPDEVITVLADNRPVLTSFVTVTLTLIVIAS